MLSCRFVTEAVGLLLHPRAFAHCRTLFAAGSFARCAHLASLVVVDLPRDVHVQGRPSASSLLEEREEQLHFS